MINTGSRLLTMIAEYKCISLNKIVKKFVAKLIKPRILSKDIFNFSGLDYRDASLYSLVPC